MTLHPEIVKRAQEQIDEVIGNDRLPTLEDRPRLPYIDCIIKEVFRWVHSHSHISSTLISLVRFNPPGPLGMFIEEPRMLMFINQDDTGNFLDQAYRMLQVKMMSDMAKQSKKGRSLYQTYGMLQKHEFSICDWDSGFVFEGQWCGTSATLPIRTHSILTDSFRIQTWNKLKFKTGILWTPFHQATLVPWCLASDEGKSLQVDYSAPLLLMRLLQNLSRAFLRWCRNMASCG